MKRSQDKDCGRKLSLNLGNIFSTVSWPTLLILLFVQAWVDGCRRVDWQSMSVGKTLMDMGREWMNLYMHLIFPNRLLIEVDVKQMGTYRKWMAVDRKVLVQVSSLGAVWMPGCVNVVWLPQGIGRWLGVGMFQVIRVDVELVMNASLGVHVREGKGINRLKEKMGVHVDQNIDKKEDQMYTLADRMLVNGNINQDAEMDVEEFFLTMDMGNMGGYP